MKKRIALWTLACLVLVGMLAGCGGKKEVTVSYSLDGSVFFTETVAPGAALELSEASPVGAYRFQTWYLTPEASQPFGAQTAPDEDTTLYAGYQNVFTGEVTTTPSASGDELDSAYVNFEDYGKVLQAGPADGGVYVVAEGYYGYHLDEDPSMTVAVHISAGGEVEEVTVMDSYSQSEGYAEMFDGLDYLWLYNGLPASPLLEVEPLAGATMTSKAIQYAVQTAAYYAGNVYGIEADTDSESMEELAAVYPATYTARVGGPEPDPKTIGSILFAADGTAADGTEVLAMKVRSGTKLSYKGSSDTGWPNAEPDPYVMVIVIDKATSQVVAWEVLVDGTKKTEYFVVPDEVIDLYKGVEITSADVFDDFRDALVFDMDVPTELDGGQNIITGTSIIYTGVSQDGTFSSQMVRHCFQAAAYYYSNS